MNSKIISSSCENMDKLYDSNAIVLEGVSGIPEDEEDIRFFKESLISPLEEYGIKVSDSYTLYLFKGKDINKHYDLEGENSYKDDFNICAISFNDIEFNIGITNFKAFKENTSWRYWCDVVDNNEYREYEKGRHKKSEQIQWLIDYFDSYEENELE